MTKVKDFADSHKAGRLANVADVMELPFVEELATTKVKPAKKRVPVDAADAVDAETKSSPAPDATAVTPVAPVRRTPSSLMLDLTKDVDFFHTPDGRTFADVQVNGARRTLSLQAEFPSWLKRAYYLATGGAATAEAVQQVVGVLGARASFDGASRTLSVRAAAQDDRIYLDLANDASQAVELTAAGWAVVDTPHARFMRSDATQPLPVPARGGSIELLRPFVNVTSEADWRLIVAWLLAALRARGPYPVLVLTGEQGTSKSTLSRLLRSLVDPRAPAERPIPRDDRDLAVAADNAHVLAFGNLSTLTTAQSDALCRLSTGGGFGVRGLYENRQEVVFDATRPVILNGIDDFISRSDLADRTIIVRLKPINEANRRTEKQLWDAFEAVRPQILGALYDGVVEGLRRLPDLPRAVALPRMADFVEWLRACETAYWPEGTFLSAYNSNRHEAVECLLDSDPVAVLVRRLAQGPGGWEGTASELLRLVENEHGRYDFGGIPRSAKLLSQHLSRQKTFLRAVGVRIEMTREGDRVRKRLIRLDAAPDGSDSASTASATSNGESNAA